MKMSPPQRIFLNVRCTESPFQHENRKKGKAKKETLSVNLHFNFQIKQDFTKKHSEYLYGYTIVGNSLSHSLTMLA